MEKREHVLSSEKISTQIATEMKHVDVIICMDKGFKFTVEDIKKQFHLGGASNVKDAWIFPKGAGALIERTGLWSPAKG